MKVNQLLDISQYAISHHAYKRWKKRKLSNIQTFGRKKFSTIEESLVTEKKIIKIYVDRETVRVSDGQYDFIVSPHRKLIITVYASENRKPSKKHKRKREDKYETIY